MDEKLKPAGWPLHPELNIRNGTIQETGDPFSEERVEEPTRFDGGYIVDVWDLRAHLAYVMKKESGMTGRCVGWSSPLTESQQEALDGILLREVEAAGGVVNRSGWYPLRGSTLRRIGRLVGKRREPSLGAQVEG